MAEYIPINPTEVEPEAPLTSSLAARWSNNPIAIAEGAPGAPRIQTAALADSAVNNSKLASGAVSSNKVAWVSTVGSWTLSGEGSLVIPAGLYLFFLKGIGGADVQVRDSGVWYTLGPLSSVRIMFSDGANMRLLNTSGLQLTIYYRKLA